MSSRVSDPQRQSFGFLYKGAAAHRAACADVARAWAAVTRSERPSTRAPLQNVADNANAVSDYHEGRAERKRPSKRASISLHRLHKGAPKYLASLAGDTR